MYPWNVYKYGGAIRVFIVFDWFLLFGVKQLDLFFVCHWLFWRPFGAQYINLLWHLHSP